MKTSAERQKEWRQRKASEGYTMISIWFDPDVSAVVGKAVEESETPHSDRQKLINSAIRELLDKSAEHSESAIKLKNLNI